MHRGALFSAGNIVSALALAAVAGCPAQSYGSRRQTAGRAAELCSASLCGTVAGWILVPGYLSLICLDVMVEFDDTALDSPVPHGRQL